MTRRWDWFSRDFFRKRWLALRSYPPLRTLRYPSPTPKKLKHSHSFLPVLLKFPTLVRFLAPPDPLDRQPTRNLLFDLSHQYAPYMALYSITDDLCKTRDDQILYESFKILNAYKLWNRLGCSICLNTNTLNLRDYRRQFRDADDGLLVDECASRVTLEYKQLAERFTLFTNSIIGWRNILR